MLGEQVLSQRLPRARDPVRLFCIASGAQTPLRENLFPSLATIGFGRTSGS
jgi:hypothetical protein